MSLLNKLNIRRKLLLYLCMPLCIALSTSAVFTHNQYQHYLTAKKTEAAVNLSLGLANIIHELQKERGLTAGFSGQNGGHFIDDLLAARANADGEISQLEAFNRAYLNLIKGEQIEGKIRDEYQQSEKGFQQLLLIRRQVDTHPEISVFDFYSEKIEHLLHFIKVIQLDLGTKELAINNNEFLSLLVIQERAGQERGALNGVFTAEKTDTRKLLDISVWGRNQYDIIAELSKTASPQTWQQIQAVLDSDVEKQVAQVRQTVQKYVHRKEQLGQLFSELSYATEVSEFYRLQTTGNAGQKIALIERIEQLQQMVTTSPAKQHLLAEEIAELNIITDSLQAMRIALQLSITQPSSQAGNTRIDTKKVYGAIHRLFNASPQFDSAHWWHIASTRLNLFRDISNQVAHALPDHAKQIAYRAEILVVLVLCLFSVSFFATFFLARLLHKRMVGEIKHISSSMTEMERSKNFNKKLAIHGKDEIAEMALAFNNLIDAKKVAQAESKISATVFENISEAIVITDANNRFQMVNPAFCRITGYTADEVIGRSPSLLKSGLHDVSYYQQMWACLKQHGLWQGEIQNRHKDGHICPELLSISVIKDSDGQVQQYIGLFSDLSQHKKKRTQNMVAGQLR